MPSPCAELSWEGLDQHLRVLRSFLARHCRDLNEADDVAQETLLRAARFRARVEDPAKLRSWLLRIASSVLKDHVRRERRLPRIEGSDELFERTEGREVEPGDWEPAALISIGGQLVLREQLTAELRLALDEVAGPDRSALARCYGADVVRECAEQVPEVAAATPARRKQQLFRARRRLYRRLAARVACVVLCGDEPDLARRASANTGRGQGALPEHRHPRS